MGKYRSPITGYNHNVRHRGWVFHVQTEDSGVQNPHIFTHCFNGGVIVNTKKMVYDAIADAEIVKALMQAQHKSVLRELKKGLYDEKIDRYLGPAPEGAEEAAGGVMEAAPVPLPPEALALAEAAPEVDVDPTQPIPVVPDELSVAPERSGAPAPFPDGDGVPLAVDEEITAASTAAYGTPSSAAPAHVHTMTIDADEAEGLEARVAGLPGMPSVEPGRWQIREPAADDVPPVGPAPVPQSTWIVRAGGYQESPFEQSRPIRVDEERAVSARAPLTQPRQASQAPAAPAVTFTSPREGTDVHARVLAERGGPQRGDEPPSGTFTINNRARKSISPESMPGPGPGPGASRSGSQAPPPWESPTTSRVEPRPNTSSGGGAPPIRPTGQRAAQGAPVRPAHPSATPGTRPSPPPTGPNVIVSRPVVLGQRDHAATLTPDMQPNGGRIAPRRTTTMVPPSAAPTPVVSEKSLDEVILAYLSEEQKPK